MHISQQKNFPLKVAGYIFGIVAIGHLLRLIFNLTITISSYTIPMSISYIALIIASLLSIWMFKASKQNHKRRF